MFFQVEPNNQESLSVESLIQHKYLPPQIQDLVLTLSLKVAAKAWQGKQQENSFID